MPPKAKKPPAGKKKSKASKRPSQTNLNVDNGRGRRNTERSVMQTLEQEEPTANNDGVQKPANAKPKDMTRTMMLPPAPMPNQIPPSTPQVPLPPAQGSQMPQVAPQMNPLVPPSRPPPQLPAQGSQIPQMQMPLAAPMPPAPRPPPGVVNQSLASPSPSPSQAQLGPTKPPVVPPQQAVVAQPSPAPPVPPQEPFRKASREKDDGSVDMAETSDKKKKTDVINSWLRLVLQSGVEGLKKEYRDSFNEAPMERATVFLDNPTRNRYHNIPCCDTTRVKLADDPYFYIHANLVSSGPNPRRFICTQAPLNGTIEDFWKMVIVSGLEYIVMLCELVEKGKPKSAEYFPLKIGDTMKIGKLCTITKESSVDIDKTLSMSTMRISKPGDNNVAKIVKHIHWRNWPDHGVPDNFLSPFRLLTVVKSCTKPVVVHCSAGVGRTGTLVLILIVLESLCAPDFLGVPRLLTKLRDERFKSIQTEMQYLYVHRCILEYLVLKKYTYSRDDYNKFAKEYEQTLAACAKE
ncbi:hypothetical protein B9Z55_002080 [Caenorhabditis nigoni]|uniref:Tyrosine-protein phosphatase domain-containing protein n=1 Tax=Caenorhabditis nigoni TaxID=1611254 RepID=A0A2G5VJ59_9PELO|nr:hypothetical protein B9Z55_002080 [Caenorhabditis nigoni]